jgi:hypothetical protein
MEVVCGGECFTAAGIPCRRELWTLGGRKVIKKDNNQTIALAVGTKAVTHSGMGAELLFLKPPGVPVETRWYMALFIKYIWLLIIRSLK